MSDKPKKETTGRNAKGQFVKGRKKSGGRTVGTQNKYGNIRDRLKELIMPYLNFDPTKAAEDGPMARSFASDLQRIDDPKDRIDAVAKILPFIVPKYSSTTITADADRPVDEEQMLMDLDGKYSKKETTITLKQVTIVNNDSQSTPSRPILTDYDPDEEDDFDIDDIQ